MKYLFLPNYSRVEVITLAIAALTFDKIELAYWLVVVAVMIGAQLLGAIEAEKCE